MVHHGPVRAVRFIFTVLWRKKLLLKASLKMGTHYIEKTMADTQQQKGINPHGSRKARQASARLSAVQALYQLDMSGEDAQSGLSAYIEHRLGRSLGEQGDDMVKPDAELFSSIVQGVVKQRDDVQAVVTKVLQ